MSIFSSLVRRDLARLWTSGSVWLPVIFFLLVATLFPFAVGPEPQLLANTGGGMLWVAALLAALLPLDRLFLADKEAGVLDQLAVRGVSDELVVLVLLARFGVAALFQFFLSRVFRGQLNAIAPDLKLPF